MPVILLFLCQLTLWGDKPLPAQPPGNLVDVGGFTMHAHTMGQTGPSVVLLAGSGNWSIHWALVQEPVSKFARVTAVDYAGLGWSQFGPPDRGLTQEAYEVHTLLKGAGVPGPYILVGHSLGGLIAHRFAHDYPRDVAGIVFVDASTPNLRQKYRDGWQMTRNRRKNRTVPPPAEKLKEQPEVRVVTMKRDPGNLDRLTPEMQETFKWFYSKPMVFAKGQRNHLADELHEMATNKQKFHLGDLPITVITGEDPKRYENEENKQERLTWLAEARSDLLALSTRSKAVSASKSGHHVHWEEPEVVIQAIQDMVER